MDIFTNKEHTVDLRNVMTLAQMNDYEPVDPYDDMAWRHFNHVLDLSGVTLGR